MPPPRPVAAGVRVSLRDLGDQLGVSHVTVSLALRGDTRISAERRAQIVALAEKMGYRPDPMLSSLSAYRQAKRKLEIRSTIAWLNRWPNPKDLRRFQEFDAYWRGAQEAANRLGYQLEEFIIGTDMSPQRLQQILLVRNVRGILLPPHAHGFELPGFDWSQFACVRLGLSIKHPRAHIVTSDQIYCARMAFERMWERGYRRIGYITSRRFDLNTGGNFRAGYLGAQDTHVPIRKHMDPLPIEEQTEEADLRALKRWLKQNRPDAVISAVSRTQELLTKVGCVVPRDLGAASLSVLDGRFDTGIDQNSLEVGRVAIATLAGLIHQNERGIPQYCRRILVEGRWLDGKSLPERVPAAAGTK